MSAVDRLDEIETRANAATAGPWLIHEMSRVYVGPGKPGSLSAIVHTSGEDPGVLTPHAAHRVRRDAEFIAAARQDVPALVNALRDVLALTDPALLTVGRAEWVEGYTGACSDIRAAIEGALSPLGDDAP